MEAAKPVPAAIYARISRDAEDKKEGVERQEADCRALAERLGWDVVGVFVDNDVSAYSGKVRPQYRAMLDAIRSGEVRAVLAWHTDRLHRRLSDLEEFVNIVEAHGVLVQTKGGDINLSTPDGRMQARILASVAQREIEHNRDRVKRAKADAANKGKYRGGPRPYGFDKDGLTVRDGEAKIIRELTTAVLAGRSLAALTRELNERIRKGDKAALPAQMRNADGTLRGSGFWRFGAVRDMLIRPRNAGLLARGLPGNKGPDFEEVGKAAWPAIVPEEEWRAVVALLTDPSRRTTLQTERRWIGSGIYRCGICGARLRVAPHGGTAAKPYARRMLYRCVESAHLTIAQPATDAYILGEVARMIRDPRVAAAMNPGRADVGEDRARRVVLEASLARAESDYISDVITGQMWKKKTEAINAELDQIDARMTKVLQRSTSSAVLRATDPGQAFLDAPLDVQRAVLSSVIKVEIITAKEAGVKIGGNWTPDRIKITPAD